MKRSVDNFATDGLWSCREKAVRNEIHNAGPRDRAIESEWKGFDNGAKL